MPDYTTNQRKAIAHDGQNLQLIACAGSGKTQVVAERIVNLLRKHAHDDLQPSNIVAFTFTEKAAGELKDRVHRLCSEQIGNDHGLADMHIGTIHGFCLDLLQTHEHRYLKYSVLSDIQQRLLIDRHSNQCGLTDLTTHDGKGLRRWVDSQLYQRILSMIRELDVNEDALSGHPVNDALEKYKRLLHKKRFIDYSMLLNEALQSLRTNPNVRAKLSSSLKYLIVDEYQDVNPAQECLIQELHSLGAELCVVGDDDQTIYQWNGSDLSNILSFSDRYHPVNQIELGANFRSTEAVVQTAESVARRNSDRLPKDMRTSSSLPYHPGDLLNLGFEDRYAEANWIAQKLIHLRGHPFPSTDDSERGLTWSDCAILLRSVKASAAPITEALRAAGVPYIIKGMSGLFDTVEVIAATAIFDYCDARIDRSALKVKWHDADLGLSDDNISEAIDWLDQEIADWPNRFLTSERSLQHTFIGFLERAGLREETVGGTGTGGRTRGEIVYYNLGKFSQLITDYELIHFHSSADSLYSGFASFLEHQAPNYYPEGWEAAGYAKPDAVQIMTIHQAKGMQFPAVFIPNMLRNRFPPKKPGGRQWHHVLPAGTIERADRLAGTENDERRLFYVALTRSKKFLYCTWAPEQAAMFRKQSGLLSEFMHAGYGLTKDPGLPRSDRLPCQQEQEDVEVPLTFSELRYYFDCPYQFKLRFMYGFNPGYNERLGFGKSLHDALAEVHRRAIDGDILSADSVPDLVERHLHLPFSWPELEEDMKVKAQKVLTQYFSENASLLDRIEHAEKPIELKLADGVVVRGRIDLLRRTDTNDIIIIDFKSTDAAQDEQLTRDQLNIYALGYRQLTGQDADYIEIYNLDEGAGAVVREKIDNSLIEQTRARVDEAGVRIRNEESPRIEYGSICDTCDLIGICRSRP